jgi:type IV pilus assembly protein PilA
MKARIGNNKGFSLIELMVVVGIIGILATVAVPQVSKFMAKAKQSEAKTNLSSLYTSEKSYFVEYTSYASEFARVGFGPEGNLIYTIGFGAAGVLKSPTDSVTTASLEATATANGFAAGTAASFETSTYCGLEAVGAANLGSPTCSKLPSVHSAGTEPTITAGNVTTASAFVAEASGAIVSNSATFDVWTMDNGKVLTNTTPGF